MKFKHGKNSLFFSGLNQEVEAYFSKNKLTKYATLETWFKAVILLSAYFGSYACIYLFQDNYWVLGGAFATIGVTGVMIVFNMVHDASHMAFSKNKKVNTFFTYLGDLVGINTHIWDIRHNIQHHTFTNVVGGDIIIDNVPLIRLSPHQPYRKFHSYQQYYAPFMYMLYTLFWMFFVDFKLFFKKEICNLKNIRHSNGQWFSLFFFKSLYLTYMIILPILLTDIPWWHYMLFFFGMHLLGGMLLSYVAVLGHFVPGPSFPADQEGILDNSWSEHQLEATIDFAPRSKIVNWITGGLNTHIVHHLYPRVSHAHYFAITPIIRDYCHKHGYIHREESLGQALRSHFKYLGIMGRNQRVEEMPTFHSANPVREPHP